jgi:RNA-binding protein YhbY
MPIREMQLGKKGITENFIGNLEVLFKKNSNVKISVLKNYCRDRDEIKKIKEELINKLGPNFKARIIGYTINIKKFRKTKKSLN